MRNVILCGDVRERLRELPDESVHCVVTSPPYWGLRDYGTAQWEGGEEGCDHKRQSVVSRASSDLDGATVTQGGAYAWRSTCGKCGARRIDSQLGLEETPEAYVENLVAVFREVRRVLRKDGTCWVNLGDSYFGGGGYWPQPKAAHGLVHSRAPTPAGYKSKDLCGIPWRVAFALQADGWWLRSDIIWSKPNPMPESVTDRPTKSHEYLFLITRSERYYYDAEAIRELHALPVWEHAATGIGRGIFNEARNDSDKTRMGGHPAGRNRRTVWEIATEPYPDAHFATFPTELVKPCILAGTSEWGCCSLCGAPWERIVERTGGTTGKGWTDHSADLTAGMSQVRGSVGAAVDSDGQPYTIRTTGWRSGCAHEAPRVPCVILDPFAGSGTVGLVAKNAGRDYVVIELNPAYVSMAEKRINVAQERLL